MDTEKYVRSLIEIKDTAPYSVNDLAKMLGINHMTLYRIMKDPTSKLSKRTTRNLIQYVDRYNQRKIDSEPHQ